MRYFYNTISGTVHYLIGKKGIITPSSVKVLVFLLIVQSQATTAVPIVPVITSFSPESGAPGTTVTITGTNFNTTAGNNIVYFGAVRATVSSATATQLVVSVPFSAACKPITVVNTASGLSAASRKLFVPSISPFLGKDFSVSSFKTPVIVASNVLFRGIASGDFDGDGKIDLVGSTGSGNSLAVVRNVTGSTVSFESKYDLLLPAGSRLVSTGDVDNDGKIDVIVGSTNASIKGLYVFRNTSTFGSISFAARVDLPADNGLTSVAVGDLDGDGKPELVASNSAGGVVSVYKNSSTPGNVVSSSFTKVNFPANAAGGGVALGDLDGNGKPEIIVADQMGVNVSIFRNTSTDGIIDANSFAAKIDFDLGAIGSHYTVSLGDLDQDGLLDIVIPKGGSANVAVFRNTSTTGTISLAPRVELALAATSFGGDIADLDGDGKIDIAVVASSNVAVFRNKSSAGSISAASFGTRIDYPAGITGSPNAFVVADINGDGKPDLVPSIPASPNSFAVLLNDAVDGAPSLPVDNNAAVNSIAENSANGTTVGITAWSKDPEGATITYSLTSNAGGRFTINASTGVVSVANGTLLDYEANSSHSITVNASDGSLSSAQTFTIAVDDVDEGPVASTATELFEDEAADAKWFNSEERIFDLVGNFHITNYPGMGYANSNYIIDNFNNCMTAPGTVGSIKPRASGYMKVESLWVFSSANCETVSNDGTVTIIGKKSGVVQYTIALDNSKLNNVQANNNGFSFVNFSEYSAANTKEIDELEFAVGGQLRYLAIDNFSYEYVSLTSASSVSFANTTATQTDISWTNGTGTSRAVFVKAGTAGTPAPADKTTYTPNSIFGNAASQIGATGWYNVYNGTGTSATVTGLNANTTYRVMVIEYNGSTGSQKYTATAAVNNPNNVTTVASLPADLTTFDAIYAANGNSFVNLVGPANAWAPGIVATNVEGYDIRVIASNTQVDVGIGVEPLTGETALAYAYTNSGQANLLALELSANNDKIFDLQSLGIAIDGLADGTSGSVKLIGYRNGLPVSGAEMTKPVVQATSGGTLVKFDVSGNSAFVGIDMFRVEPVAGTTIAGAIAVDNINAINFRVLETSAPVAGLGKALNVERSRSEGVRVSNHPSLNFGTGSFTIEAWVKRGAGSGFFTIAGKQAASGGAGYFFRFNDNKLSFYAGTNGSTLSSTISDDAWHHVAAVHSSSRGSVSIYVDGVTKDEVLYGMPSNVDNSTLLGIGYKPNYSENFDGGLDEVRIWNTARTEAQIREFMNTPLSGAESGLVAYWNFEEGTGTSIDDRSANNNTGTLLNGNSNEFITGNTNYTASLSEDSPLTLRLGGSDLDDQSTATAKIASLPVKGKLFQTYDGLTKGAEITSTSVLLADIGGNPRRVIYQPAANYNGPDSFTYLVNDGDANSANTGIVSLNITAVNDAPLISSDGGGATASLSLAENLTAVTTVTATDIDNTTLTYSLNGGADQAKFTINALTGELRFSTAPNFEVPADADGNNTYIVTVRASDGSTFAEQTITVSVTDVDDKGIVLVTSSGGTTWDPSYKLSSVTSGDWTSKAVSLQTALTNADLGDEIWVASGTYKPSVDFHGNTNPAEPRQKTFKLLSGVKMYGGFEGTETALSQRNWNINKTILSGDLGIADDINDNSFRVLVGINVNNQTKLDGFVIRDGFAASGAFLDIDGYYFYADRGAGLHLYQSSPEINNCKFQNNLSNYIGGAIYNEASSPALNNVLISGNKATGGGGGFCSDNQSNPVLTNVTITGNSHGISGNLTLKNSIVTGNSVNIAPLSLTTGSRASLVGNTWYNAAGEQSAVAGPAPSDIFAGPLAASSAPTADGDYALKANSWAINKGDNSLVSASSDLALANRTFDTAVDLGAFERQMKQQIISFTGLVDDEIKATYGDEDLSPATAGTTVSFSVPVDNGVASIVDGKIKILAAGVVTVTVSAAGNSEYDPAVSVSKTLRVERKTIAVSAAAKAKTYGESDPAFTFTHTPALVGADTFSGSLGRATGEGAGSYAINSGTLALNDNYTINFTGADLTINKAPLTITANNLSKTYGDDNPALTVNYAGLKNGETSSVVSLTIATTATNTSPVGTYDITPSGTTDNYEITFVKGKLTVNKKALTVTADDQSKTYGDDNPAFTAKYSGLVNGETALSPAPVLTTTATASSGVGTYDIIPSGTAANYDVTFVKGTLTVDKKALTVTADDQSKTYGENNPAFTLSYSGLVNGETALSPAPTFSTTANAASGVGNYDILPSGTSANYELTFVKGTLTVNKKALTVTADDQSKTYGDDNPTLTLSYSGLVNGETGLNPAPSVNTAATSSSGVGTYDIIPTGTASNYDVTFVKGTLTVNKKALTVSADDQSKTYGDDNPIFTLSYSGLVNGETALSPAPVLSTTATTTSGVGTYDIIPSGTSANYDVTFVKGTLTINKKSLTVKADDQSKTYGDVNPALTVSYSGLVNGETALSPAPSVSTAAGATSDVGSYDIIASGTAANYDVTFVKGVLIVNKKALTVTADDQSKTYGDNNPALTVSYSGLVNGEIALNPAPLVSTTAGSTSGVGSYDIIPTGAAANYEVSFVKGTLTINKAALTISAKSDSKIYDAAAYSGGNGLEYSGFIAGDDASNSITGTAIFGGDSQGATAAGTYTITASGLNAANYAITYTNGTLTISKAALMVTAKDDSKTYDATAYSGGRGLEYNGFKGNDDASNSLTGTLSYGGNSQGALAAGTYTVVPSGLSSSNYTINYANGTLTINKAALTVTAKDAGKIYDGLAYSNGNGLEYSGFAGSDDASNSVSGTLTYGGTSQGATSAGTYSIIPSGLSSSNYNISYTDGTLTISKAALTVTAKDDSKIYDGLAYDAGKGVDYNGFVSGDNASNSISGILIYGGNSQAAKAAGTYTINVSGLSASNYEISYADGTLVISKAALTVAAEDDNKIYDALAYSGGKGLNYSGFVSGDDASNSISGAISYGGTSQGAIGAGTYSIMPSGLSSANYAISYTQGTLTINKAALNVTANDAVKTYDAVAYHGGNGVTYSGFAGNDNQSNSLGGGISYSGTSQGAINAGSYVISPSGLNSANYEISYTNGTLKVDPRAVTVAAEAKTKVYGDADPALSYGITLGTLAGTDNFSGSLSRQAGEAAGNYAIDQNTLSLGNNYTLSYVPAELSITKKVLTVAAQNQTKVYGSANPAFTVSYAGFITGEGVADLNAEPLASSTATPQSPVGDHSIIPSGGAAGNYSFNYLSGTLTVTKAPLTITADNKTRVQNTANPMLTASYSGFVNGETNAVLVTQPLLSTPAVQSSMHGTYPITVSGATAMNYQISYVGGELIVTPGSPTSLTLNTQSLYENQPAGTLAGMLASTSDDPNAIFSYTLEAGTGSADNALFQIVGNELRTNAVLNFESKVIYRIRVRTSTQYGLSLEKQFSISIGNVNEQPTINALANSTICYTPSLQTVALSGITAGEEAGERTALSVSTSNNSLFEELTVGQASASGTAELRYQLAAGASGTAVITVLVQDNGGTANGGMNMKAESFTLTVNALPEPAISSNKGLSLSKGETAVLTAEVGGGNSGLIYQWSDANGIQSVAKNLPTLEVRPSETTTYTLTVTNANGCSTTQTITIEVLADYKVVDGTNIVTPNGDGVNDNFIIRNIDMYPNNVVKIFDRAGRLLYSKNSYSNEWTGTFQGSPLAEDTYYYIVDFGSGIQKIKGFITIVRDK